MKSLDYEAAKKHCSQRYESGSLCNFKDGSDLKECLTDLAKPEPSDNIVHLIIRLLSWFVNNIWVQQQDEGFFCQVNQGNKSYSYL
jgi:hypothetical protein